MIEGWPDLLYVTIDAVDVDMQPVRDHNLPFMVYIISFIFFGYEHKSNAVKRSEMISVACVYFCFFEREA